MSRRRVLVLASAAGSTAFLARADATGADNASNRTQMRVASRQGANPSNFVRRRFVRVEGRGVHYLRAGDGPPVVLLHAANSSARSQMPLLERLVSDHTVFAFDHPGFGDSDCLPGKNVRAADAADALQETLAELQIPRCPVYGSHTGGSVAIELARRHPGHVAALLVDGVPAFSVKEAKFFRSEDYMPAFKVHDDGSHLFATWVKTRDSATWFPWSQRTAGNRRRSAFPSPESIHVGFLERLRAGDGYRSLYSAAFKHNAREAMAALTVPGTFMAIAADPLFSHLDRLPPLRPDQRIERYRTDAPDYMGEVVRVLRGYRVQTAAPPDAPFQPTRGAINRRYVDRGSAQILVRSAGEAGTHRPLLLLHEGRASSRVIEPLMRVLAQHRPVYAPDLPDNGASDVLAARDPGIGEYADAVVETMTALRLAPCDIYAVGAGAAVALELLAKPAFAESRGLLEAPDFYTEPLVGRLAREWAPPLAPEWDGAHLNRLWLMLRDEYAFWPWFDKSSAAACAMDAPSDWHEMHARVVDILRSLPTYHRLTAAVLRYDWPGPLREAGKRGAMLGVTSNDPRRLHTEAAARLADLPEVATLPVAADAKARSILRLLSR